MTEITTGINVFDDLEVGFDANDFIRACLKVRDPEVLEESYRGRPEVTLPVAYIEEVVQAALDRAASLRASLETARQALKPFAEIGKRLGPGMGDCLDFKDILHDDDPAEITVGDLRNAARVFLFC